MVLSVETLEIGDAVSSYKATSQMPRIHQYQRTSTANQLSRLASAKVL